MKISAEKRWATAYHEAGHATAAIRLGIGIGRKGINIVPNGDSFGAAHVLKALRGKPEVGSSGAMRLKAESRAIVSLAGEIAQRKFRATRTGRAKDVAVDEERGGAVAQQQSSVAEDRGAGLPIPTRESRHWI